ncbi:MAG TPA: hypothetical protein ENI34_05710 [candidate division WOR-3 bacterium]|uniref:Calcineurin-like phosphoesterase domain-containing protein n=1 Tax=candidate division WOR-3 bacterium TaxID=2052148 RepID=A0A9C9EMX2_UNCW3|nr:hypothetical protein [candidate division WOR-3 bacterium]
MRFLHTADLHLKGKDRKRMEIFRWLIEEAGRLKIDYFIIAGDLFNSDTDAVILRNNLRMLFKETTVKFLLVPGNHDEKSFSDEYDYGENVIQLTTEPFHIIELDKIVICAVPYQNRKFSECIKNIPSGVDILIAHGTLYDKSFIVSSLKEIEAEYMPIYPANLHKKARYVALGHFHSRSFQKEYEGVRVVYPGSPIGLDTKCDGERVFFVVEIDQTQLKIEQRVVEAAPYWQRREFFVFPGNEEQIFDKIRNHLLGIKSTKIMPNIVIKGFIKESDRGFKDRLEKLEKEFQNKFPDMKFNFAEIQSWRTIIQNEVVEKFIDKSRALEDTLRQKVFEIVFPVFSKMLK